MKTMEVNNIQRIFDVLKSVSKKSLKDEIGYRTLNTTNGPKVRERLIDYKGTKDFLYLIGYQSDVIGMKLTCHVKPTRHLIMNASTSLNECKYLCEKNSLDCYIQYCKSKGFIQMIKYHELLIFGYIRQSTSIVIDSIVFIVHNIVCVCAD